MKTLLWKDYRQNRAILLAAGILVAVPYLIIAVYIASDILAGRRWASVCEELCGASIWATILACGMAAFIAGNAFAGERADRSAEFAAYLPIKRHKAMVSKLLLAVLACTVPQLVSIAVYFVARAGMTGRVPWPEEGFLFSTASAVLLFGVAWLVSSFARSPVIAAASGLGTLLVLVGLLATLEIHRNPPSGLVRQTCFDWYPGLCFGIGLIAFAAGTIYYLRRVEP